MKKIMYILVFLICVSLVSASVFNLKLKKHSKELVTCGDFTCNDTWVGFTTIGDRNWTFDSSLDRAVHQILTEDEPANNLSQTINIKPNTRYNVTMNISLTGGRGGLTNLSVYLGGVKGFFNSTTVAVSGIFSFNITTKTTDDLVFEAYTFLSPGGSTVINSISVKEVKDKVFRWKPKRKNTDKVFRWKLKRK